jgi:hypothetical protein
MGDYLIFLVAMARSIRVVPCFSTKSEGAKKLTRNSPKRNHCLINYEDVYLHTTSRPDAIKHTCQLIPSSEEC